MLTTSVLRCDCALIGDLHSGPVFTTSIPKNIVLNPGSMARIWSMEAWCLVT
jgi:hypothetical protein